NEHQGSRPGERSGTHSLLCPLSCAVDPSVSELRSILRQIAASTSSAEAATPSYAAENPCAGATGEFRLTSWRDRQRIADGLSQPPSAKSSLGKGFSPYPEENCPCRRSRDSPCRPFCRPL